MMDILTDQGLWDYIDGSSLIPSEESQKTAWKKKDCTALSTIRLQVADQMLVYVASASTSKEVWETLKSFLEVQGALCWCAGNCSEHNARKVLPLRNT